MIQKQNMFIRNSNIDIFSESRAEIDPVKYFVQLYNETPNHYAAYFRINISEALKKLKKKYKLKNDDFIVKHEYAKDTDIYRVDKNISGYFINVSNEIMLFITSYKATFYYSNSIKFFEIKDIIKNIDPAEQRKMDNKSYFSMILFSNNSESGYELKNFDIKSNTLKLEDNYNNDFVPVSSKIIDFLSDDKKTGLVLLHGKYGTGKTSYIKYLMTQAKKRFILLPQSMLSTISNPDFFLFLSEYKNSVLILEDCDSLLVNAVAKNNPLTHFLSLAEGLLSETYNYKIICSLSASSREINEDVIRKSKLIVNYEFKELSKEKAQKLSDEFGSKDIIKKPTILSEIYNKKEKNLGNFKDKKLGFNS